MAGNEAAAEGLTYFDGSRFVPVLKGRFPKVLVGGMAEDSEGGLWIASSGGLLRLFKGQLQKEIEGFNAQRIIEVFSNVLLATIDTADSDRSALVRITKVRNAWKNETIMERPYRIRFELSGDGNVVYPCPDGFCEFRGAEVARGIPGQTPRVVYHRLPSRPIPRPRLTLKDRFGCIWMRSNQKAWYECPGGPQPTVLPPSVAGRGSDAIAELEDGSIAIASFAELAIGRPGNFRVLSALNGYPSIGGWLVRKDGSIWLGSANGLFAFSSRLRMEFWTERDGLGGNTWSILPLDKKTFAIAGEQIRVLDEDRTRWHR